MEQTDGQSMLFQNAPLGRGHNKAGTQSNNNNSRFTYFIWLSRLSGLCGWYISIAGVRVRQHLQLMIQRSAHIHYWVHLVQQNCDTWQVTLMLTVKTSSICYWHSSDVSEPEWQLLLCCSTVGVENFITSEREKNLFANYITKPI